MKAIVYQKPSVKFQPANAKLKRLREKLALEYGRKPNIYGLVYRLGIRARLLKIAYPKPIGILAN